MGAGEVVSSRSAQIQQDVLVHVKQENINLIEEAD